MLLSGNLNEVMWWRCTLQHSTQTWTDLWKMKDEWWKRGTKIHQCTHLELGKLQMGAKILAFFIKETVVKRFIVKSVKFIGCSRLRTGLLLRRSLSFSTELEGFHSNLSLDNYFSFRGGPQFSSRLSIPVSESPHPLSAFPSLCMKAPVLTS